MDVMRQVFSIARLLPVLCIYCGTLGAATAASEILDQARTLVANREYQKSAAVLEEGLSAATAAERGEMVGLLRQVYRNLINQAEASGKAREAAEYRDNLAILGQASGTPTANPGQADSAHILQSSPAPPAPAATSPQPIVANSTRLPRLSANPDQLPFKDRSPPPEPAPLPALEGPGPDENNSHPVIPPPNKVSALRQFGCPGRGGNSPVRRCVHSSPGGEVASLPDRTAKPDNFGFDPVDEFELRSGPSGSIFYG